MLIFQIIVYLNTEIECIIYIKFQRKYFELTACFRYFMPCMTQPVTTQNTCFLIIIVKGIALSQSVKSVLNF